MGEMTPAWLGAHAPLSAALGGMVGLVLGLTGAGGAILSVPLLVFGLDLTIAQAGPIGLLAVSVTAGLGALLALRAGHLRYRAAMVIAAAGLLTSPLGLWAAHRVANRPLTMVFALVLAVVSVRMFLQARHELRHDGEAPRRQAPPCRLDAATGRLHWTAPCARALIGAGMIAGFLSGLLGVGGGFVIVPALRRYTDLPMRTVIATSMGVLALVSAGGVLLASLDGKMDWMTALPFVVGAKLGGLVARRLASRLAGPHLTLAFAGVTLAVALSLVVRAA